MPDLINGDAERPEHASHPFPKIDPNKLWMIIWVDAIDHWLLFRAFERGPFCGKVVVICRAPGPPGSPRSMIVCAQEGLGKANAPTPAAPSNCRRVTMAI
jgi:hypothetical protein